jgi:hypothetical protein
VTIYEHWIDDSAVPLGGIKLDGVVDAIDTVLLGLRPELGEAASDEMVPTNGLLRLN